MNAGLGAVLSQAEEPALTDHVIERAGAVTERVCARFAPDRLRAEADVLGFTSVRNVASHVRWTATHVVWAMQTV